MPPRIAEKRDVLKAYFYLTCGIALLNQLYPTTTKSDPVRLYLRVLDLTCAELGYSGTKQGGWAKARLDDSENP